MDYDFYLRASQRHEFHDIDLLTTRMRVHPEAKTSHGWDNFAADVQQRSRRSGSRGIRCFTATRSSACGCMRPRATCRIVHRPPRGPGNEALRELKRAAAWWPPLPLLPAFYPYCGRVGLATSSANRATHDCGAAISEIAGEGVSKTRGVRDRLALAPSLVPPSLRRYSAARRSEGYQALESSLIWRRSSTLGGLLEPNVGPRRRRCLGRNDSTYSSTPLRTV